MSSPSPSATRVNASNAIADEGIDNLIEQVDSLIVVLNEKLFDVMDEDATLEDAFKRADDVLNNAVAGIAEIINVPGLVNVDFADVKTIMGEQGKAMMGIGEASGLDRARLAAEQAVSSPLLDGVDLHGARGVIVNITPTALVEIARDQRSDQHDQAVLRRRRDDHPRHRLSTKTWTTRCA